MPDFNSFSDNSLATPGGSFGAPSNYGLSGGALTLDQAKQASSGQPSGYNWATTIVGDSLMAPMDLVDTVASSTPFVSKALGIQRGDFNHAVLNAIDNPGLSDFYEQNKDGIAAASGIGTILAVELATGGLATAAPFVGVLSKVGWAKKALALDNEYKTALSVVNTADLSLAEQGITGSKLWTSVMGESQAGRTLVSGAGEITAKQAVTPLGQLSSRAMGLGIAKGVATAAKGEALYATFLNQNQFLYSTDFSTNVANAALGLGVGGAFGGIATRYAMRKFVNSDLMRRTISGALDPTGMQRALTQVVSDGSVPENLAAKGMTQKQWDSRVKGTNLHSGVGATTDRFSAEMLSARAEDMTGKADPNTYSRLQTQTEANALATLNQATKQGLPSVSGTGFSTNAAESPGWAHQIRQLTHNDPTAMNGVEAIAAVGDDVPIQGLHDDFQRAIAKQKQDVLDLKANPEEWNKLSPAQQANQNKVLADARFKETWIAQPTIDGQVTTMEHAAIHDNWVEPDVRFKNIGDQKVWEAHDPKTGKSMNIAVDDTGLVTLPGDARPADLGYEDAMTLWRVQTNRMNSMAKDPQAILNIPAKADFTQLDMAEALLQKNPNAKVVWPEGMSRESAQVESLAQKFAAYTNKVFPNKTRAAQGLEAAIDPKSLFKFQSQLNLPRVTAQEAGLLGTQETPIDTFFRGMYKQGLNAKSIRDMSLSDVQSVFDKQRQIGGITIKQGTHGDSLTGNALNFLQDYQGNPMKPVLMYRRNMFAQDWMPDRLEERIAIDKAQRTQYLVNPARKGETNKQVMGMILSSPDARLISEGATSLNDRQIMGAVSGGSPTSGMFSRFTNALSTVEHRFRDSPIGLATQRFRETVDNVTRGIMKNKFEQAFGDQLVTINSPRNVTSRFMLNQFHTHSLGWDLLPKPVERELADGTKGWAFQVDPESVGNRNIHRQMYGTELDPKNPTILKDGKGNDILMDDTALQFQKSFNALTDYHRLERNELLDSQGLPTISSKPWYVPSPSLDGDIVGHTFDPSNNIIAGGTIRAKTQKDFDTMFAKMKADPNSPMNQDGHTFHTRDEVREFSSALQLAKAEMSTPGRLWTAGGKSNTGKLLGPETNMAALDESLETIRNGFMQHGRDLIESHFQEELKAINSRSKISGEAAEVTPGRRAIPQEGKNVFDYMGEALLGRSPLNSEKSWLGRANELVESAADPLLRQGQIGVSRAWGAANTMLSRVNPFAKTPKEEELFQKIVGVLGKNSPFESAADLMEAKGYGVRPATLKSLGSAGGRFESTWLLRMMEPVQAFMNLSGVINAAPAILRHLQPTAEELLNKNLYAQRVGHHADIFETPEGGQMGTMNMAKLLYKSFQDTWSGASHPDWARKAANGYLSQDVAEFHKAFKATELGGDGPIAKFWKGDPTSSNRFAQKGIEGWSSLLTDKSEDFSRGWAHMIGDNIGKHLGIADNTARDAFAHDIANKMIANYNPLNRPAIFQGAVGTPIGLFQGFIWAYYQRMFRYLETGDRAALATQYATQAASFGVKTVPGFQEVNQWWFDHSDGKSDPYDKIYKSFGAPAGDLLMGGVWGNLPKLLGGSAIDLSTRGNTSMGIPVVTLPATIQTMQKIGKGVGQMASLFGSQNPHLSASQVGEVLANTIPNRPIAGMIESLGQGDTDPTGQLVSRNKSWMDVAGRVMGVRSMTDQASIEAFYANKQSQEIMAQKKQDLNRNTRMLIRGGDAGKLQGAFESYVADGGDPRHYKQWVHNQIKAATQTRSERQLLDSLHNPNNQYMADRLLGAQTGITQEANEPDPAQTMAVQDSMENDQPTNSPNDSTRLMYGDPATGFNSM